ncbi:MAG TPA: methionine--tRNA ligase, partial [Polyangiaceae bacterium]
LLVTSALPYANYHIHLGHMLEHVQTNIWVRFQRMRGRKVAYICADDTHGTAITMRARQEGKREEDVIREMSLSHQRDFEGFDIRFDHYGSTHSPSNRALCAEVWAALRQKNMIAERDVTQLFDPEAGVFLADRFVKGTCPRCGTPNQYGDSCESCGSTYSPTDLKDPKSTLSGARPEVRSARHYFVQIEQLHDFLTSYTQQPGVLQPEVANYLRGYFLGEPLRDWDVSRPAPYFGFEIPDAPGHHWYVWFDAPIGYMAATADWCERSGELFDDWWRSSDTEIVHFIGKDITYFHALFWPAMLKSAGFPLPARIHVHGFLTVNGEKMSKSRGTFILASSYLEHLDPAYLRYYLASKLGNGVEDLDLNLEELVTKVNAEVVGKVVNLASRSARFVETLGLSPEYPDDGGLFETAAKTGDEIAHAYEACDYARATRAIMALADRANEYVDRKEPWKLAKAPERSDELRDVCTVVLNLYRQLALYLAPVLPRLAAQSAVLLGAPLTDWSESKTPQVGTPVGRFQHLMQRVDPKKVEALLATHREATEPAATTERSGDVPNAAKGAETAASNASALAASDDSVPDPFAAEPLAPECTIDDFAKVDLRVARVVSAEDVPEAKKLLKLTVSLGPGVTRTVFAGIKAAYKPEDLVGRLVVVVANLAPRKMKLGTSEGMVVAAGPGEKEVFLLSPDSGAKPGQRIH